MILIFSSNGDYDTNTVCKWIRFFEKDFIRINSGDDFILKEINLQTGDILIQSGERSFNLKDIRTVWYRRNALMNIFSFADWKSYSSKSFKAIGDAVSDILEADKETLVKYLYHVLENKKRCLTRFSQGRVNKLIVLEKAREAGLTVPDSWVLTSPAQVNTVSPELDLITKSADSGLYLHTKTKGYYTYTESVTAEMVAESTEHFFPSLVQKKISKTIELRVFFLEEAYYAMAIFSQLHELSMVDNRKGSAFNKWVPYKLPDMVREKLIKLMKALDLKTGSVDLLVTEENDFVFLEVNPVGQIGMTSYPCNYNLHKKIAEWMIR